ncbi:hypothetical protein D5F01_LYC24931 [Larimichthys crocea]|uniref:Uncharacterized protein n=1 Tax=Larimichthys crocea TaxID=215358 RepID=A0A6G0HDW1_LARCR|nr:hypothetical protein D5F01_LYC24931 [Larimichthys crocea]
MNATHHHLSHSSPSQAAASPLGPPAPLHSLLRSQRGCGGQRGDGAQGEKGALGICGGHGRDSGSKGRRLDELAVWAGVGKESRRAVVRWSKVGVAADALPAPHEEWTAGGTEPEMYQSVLWSEWEHHLLQRSERTTHRFLALLTDSGLVRLSEHWDSLWGLGGTAYHCPSISC